MLEPAAGRTRLSADCSAAAMLAISSASYPLVTLVRFSGTVLVQVLRKRQSIAIPPLPQFTRSVAIVMSSRFISRPHCARQA